MVRGWRADSDPTNNYSTDLLGMVRYQPTRKQALELDKVPFPLVTKRRRARPTHFSLTRRQLATVDLAEAQYGAQLQGLPLFRQGEEAAALIAATTPDGLPRYQQCVILMPRRATKSTSIWSQIIGRCAARPGLRVYFTAQDGQRAREILRLDIMENLRAQGFEQNGHGTFRVANGDESVIFANGSFIRALPPKPSIFRSKAADIIFLDEAGEYAEDLGDALLQAALPLMDTRPHSQIIISGTPAPGRAGLLWEKLQDGMDKTVTEVGVLAYMITDDESAVNDDGTMNEKVLYRVHPGIGTLTTIATIRSRFRDLTKKHGTIKFEMEYLCRFPVDVSSAAIPAEVWAAASRGPALPVRPAHVGLAIDTDPDNTTAALVAAWRDTAGHGHLEVLAVGSPSEIVNAAQRAATKHRTPVGYDQIGANVDHAQVLTRRKTRTNPLPLRYMQAATARFDRELRNATLHHHDQTALDDAAAGACWRTVGEGGKLFGRRASTASVAPLVAAAVALWQYDQTTRTAGAASATPPTNRT